MQNIKLMFKYALTDLVKQRVRTILGIVGITISVGLLAIVLFLSDSISVSFVTYMSQDAGNQDMTITVRHYNGEPANRSSYFYSDPIAKLIEDSDRGGDIEDYIPRLEVDGKVNITEGFGEDEITDQQESALISGINLDFEKEIEFGSFVDPETSEFYDLELEAYHCAIQYGFNDLIRYDEGDKIKAYIEVDDGGQTIEKNVTFTVDKIFDFALKWPAEYRYDHLIVVDVETLYNILGYSAFEGRCSQLILTLSSGNEVYDVRDVDGSSAKVKEIAGDIQEEIGLSEYNIDLPKLTILGYAEFLSMGLTVIFIFVSIIAMLIAGILINGILKTSVEERIREFGIFRTLGAYKSFNLAVVLIQGLLLCFIGSAIGILGAFFGTSLVILPAVNTYWLGDFLGPGQGLTFSWTPASIFIALAMGMSVGLLVSISPALKVMRLQLIESIHPYRHEDTLYHLQKKASVNYKLILVGIILAVNGGFIYFVIPRLLISMDITLLAGTLISILLIFLIGLTLAGLGLMPVILRGVIELFRPAAKRLYHVVKIFVFRYQRRNTSTVIIFALSFSFVMFTSTIFQTQSAQVGVLIELRYGSDLVMESTGWLTEEEFFGGVGGGGGIGFFSDNTISQFPDFDGGDSQNKRKAVDANRIMTTDFEEQLLAIEGVEKVSSVLASPFELTQIYSEKDKEFSAQLGDYAGLSTIDITLIGVDEEYPSTIKTEYMSFSQGDPEEAFDQVFHNNTGYHCIISEAIAIAQKLNINDKIRLMITRGDETENYVATIVGMAISMPGFAQQFGGTQYSADGGGVLISQETYIDVLDIPEPAWVDKFFIKLQDNKISVSSEIEEDIDSEFKNNYDYNLFNLEQTISEEESAFSTINTLFTLILLATVVICLFGLLSSSYSTIVERKKEIGIVRTLGLKGHEINRLFIIEALIIMISSGTVGVLVGLVTGWLLSSNLNLFTDIPYHPAFPLVNFTAIYGISILFILVGMSIMLRKSRKQKIIDIYRETM